MLVYLSKGHWRLSGKEQSGQVCLHLIPLLGILLHLARQVIILLDTFSISGIVHP